MCRKFAIKMKLVKVSAMWCPACLIMRSRMDKLNLDIDDLDRMVKKMTKGFEDIFTEPEEDDTQP